MGVLDKVRKFKNSRPKNDGNRTRTKGIFHDWQDGPNRVRLVGEFLEVKTHFIAPAKARGERGLCQGDAFDPKAQKRLSMVVNCPDWDTENEEEASKKTCPICKLYRLAVQALKENPNDEEKKYFEGLKQLARVRTSLKWNVFDRDNPNVTVIDENGNESKQKGLKIATIGMEAWDDIEGIFAQCGFDITDAEEGVDINVIKGHNGTRVSYSAQVVLDGKGLAVTPFDDEEQEIVAQPHDLKNICAKKTEGSEIMDALHGDYAELLELNEEDDDDSSYSTDEDDSSSYDDSEEEEDVDEEEGVDDDDDDMLGGTSQKKKKK